VTGADPNLVEYKDSELLTTKIKNVDISKAVKDLGNKESCSLEEGIQKTAEWMSKQYKIKTVQLI
jgi:dTDP-glucose 4,6-dehydratase